MKELNVLCHGGNVVVEKPEIRVFGHYKDVGTFQTSYASNHILHSRVIEVYYLFKQLRNMSNKYFPERSITFDDLKFVCYMIERTARNIRQPNAYVVDCIGKEGLLHNLSLADVLHCENPDDVVDKWKKEYSLENGNKNVLDVDKTLSPIPPTSIQMGKVYARLIQSTTNSTEDLVDGILRVYHSPICQQLDNYNSSAYYEPSYVITRAYNQGSFN